MVLRPFSMFTGETLVGQNASFWRSLRESFSRSEFAVPANNLLVQTIRDRAVSNSPPVWMMRQAGRYLPEFRALRAENDFVKVCKDPDLASEVTIQPWRRYASGSLCEIAKSLPYSDITSSKALDAVIVFSDILTIPAALGQSLEMVPGRGPVLSPALSADSLDPLPSLSASAINEQLGYVYDAVFATRVKLNSAVPVIGFSGAPWTLFSYMVEGGGSKTWAKARVSFYKRVAADPDFLKPLEDVIVQYLIGQYDAGADVLQIFDTNADELPASIYGEIVMAGLVRIVKSIKAARPDALVAVFPKDYRGNQGLGELALVSDVLGVGWKEPIGNFADRVEKAVGCERMPVIQGNLDPAMLLTGDKVLIEEAVKEMRAAMQGRSWIANLGHGMMPEMNPMMAKMFLETVKGM